MISIFRAEIPRRPNNFGQPIQSKSRIIDAEMRAAELGAVLFSSGDGLHSLKAQTADFSPFIIIEKFLVTCLVAYIHSVDPFKVQTAIKIALPDKYGSYSKSFDLSRQIIEPCIPLPKDSTNIFYSTLKDKQDTHSKLFRGLKIPVERVLKSPSARTANKYVLNDIKIYYEPSGYPFTTEERNDLNA